MVKITVLGNCAGLSETSHTTSYVIETEKTKVLFDTGPGVVRQLKRANISASDIDLVIVTHCHCDHTLEFPYFLFSNLVDRMLGKKGPDKIPVIALGTVFKGLKDMVAFTCPPGEFPFEIVNWQASETEECIFEFQDMKIATVPVNHSVPNIGVSFDINSTKIVFSSDTSYDDGLIKFALGCDALFHETFAPSNMKDFASGAGHSTAEEVGKAARESGAKMLILSHIMALYIDKPDILIEEAKKHFSGDIIAPSELEIIEINSKEVKK